MPSADPADPAGTRAPVVACVDVGSTFTKAVLVDRATARIVATAGHRTTVDSDVLDGLGACRAALAEQDPRAAAADVLVCSSAGGGLRVAVLGNEELVTAEAGRRVALSSGGTVVAVVAAAGRGPETGAGHTARLLAARPDVVLLTGGTDGGNAEVLVAAAADLAAGGWTGPVVVAGNVEAQAEVVERLAGLPHVLADNVVPRIGVLAPASARAAVREVFLAHVIGGKHLSASPDFARMVRGATPDVVLRGVELLARGLGPDRPGVGDVVVVDVGGATTDVHSVVELDPEEATLARDVVAATPVTRTVEGDLGMRWSAVTTAEATGRDDLLAAARARRTDPGLLPDDDAGREADEQLGGAAAALAVRRHAGRSRVVVGPEGRVVERTGVDLREVALVVASGGVFRHGRPGVAERVLAGAVGVHEGGWQLPEHPRLVVDDACVLTAVGLLADDEPELAHRLATDWLRGGAAVTSL